MCPAQLIKYVPKHKTGKKDSALIAKILPSGLMKGSFISPPGSRPASLLLLLFIGSFSLSLR